MDNRTKIIDKVFNLLKADEKLWEAITYYGEWNHTKLTEELERARMRIKAKLA